MHSQTLRTRTDTPAHTDADTCAHFGPVLLLSLEFPRPLRLLADRVGFCVAAYYIFLGTIFTFFMGFTIIGYIKPKTSMAIVMVIGGPLGMVRACVW